MTGFQCKNKNMISQINMLPLETSSLISTGLEKRNLAEVQEKDFKIPIMIMLRDLEKDMNESLKGSENTSG